MTCSTGGAARDLIARYVERYKTGEQMKTAQEMYEYLVANHGYGWLSYSAMMKHMRGCLGYRARGR